MEGVQQYKCHSRDHVHNPQSRHAHQHLLSTKMCLLRISSSYFNLGRNGVTTLTKMTKHNEIASSSQDEVHSND